MYKVKHYMYVSMFKPKLAVLNQCCQTFSGEILKICFKLLVFGHI